MIGFLIYLVQMIAQSSRVVWRTCPYYIVHPIWQLADDQIPMSSLTHKLQFMVQAATQFRSVFAFRASWDEARRWQQMSFLGVWRHNYKTQHLKYFQNHATLRNPELIKNTYFWFCGEMVDLSEATNTQKSWAKLWILGDREENFRKIENYQWNPASKAS